ncbi:hypothetical protein BsWGS_27220 [Bradybaena similaris]
MKIKGCCCIVVAALFTLAQSSAYSAKEMDSLSLYHQSRRLMHADDKDSDSHEDGKHHFDRDDVKDKSQVTKSSDELSTKKLEKGNLGFLHAFIASFSVIIVSEIGDKTFFIAAIMAMTHSRLTVLMGALFALFVMTFLSAIVGFAATVVPRALTYYVSSALFAVFGLKMLREGWLMSDDEGKEEYEEVQADLKRRENEMEKQNLPTQDIETGIVRTPGRRFLSGILSTVFLQSMTLTFLAEWGDRSQIATIILGAREDIFGVMLGGCIGHTVCTSMAVLGGRFVAQRISVRTVTLIGGVVFLIFALSALWIGPDT